MMDRRETIKSLLLGSVATGFVLNGCTTEVGSEVPQIKEIPPYGRTAPEKLIDKELFAKVFFNEHELSTIATLCDIILPSNDKYGSATDAGVHDFIEFIVKDMTHHQTPIRGGLMWLDSFSNKLYNKEFVKCSKDEQLHICDQIAFPKRTAPELKQGEKFFTRMRNLTMIGYFTSKEGIDDLGYKGNTPNIWDGIPEDVLQDHGLKYDEKWLAKCVDQSKRDVIAKWDDQGNLIS